MLLLLASIYHALQTIYAINVKEVKGKEVKDVEAHIPVRREDPKLLKENVMRIRKFFKRILIISDDVK
jgi:hypothetical protein